MSGFRLGFVNVFVLDFLEHCKKKLRNLLCIKCPSYLKYSWWYNAGDSVTFQRPRWEERLRSCSYLEWLISP